MKAAYDTPGAFDRLEHSLQELSAQVVALTAVVGAIATVGAVDYERLEQCVNFAARAVRFAARPILLAKASAMLADFEKMQRALQIESRKRRGLRRRAAKPKLYAVPAARAKAARTPRRRPSAA